jgi:hypothetical protein
MVRRLLPQIRGCCLDLSTFIRTRSSWRSCRFAGSRVFLAVSRFRTVIDTAREVVIESIHIDFKEPENSIMVVKITKPIIPPLENGDRLTRGEFERRYNAMPPHVRAELINGVVYMASPVRVRYHGDPHGNLHVWLGHYQTFTPGVRSPIDSTIRFDDKNEQRQNGMTHQFLSSVFFQQFPAC